MSETTKIGLNGLTRFLEHIKTLLNGKVDKVSGKQLSTEDYTTAEKTKLANIDMSTKVDKETGKGLSSNDYTIAEKTKLASALTTANIVDNLTSTSTTDALSANMGRVLNSNVADRFSTAKIYIERGNFRSFTISGLNAITNTSIYKHAIFIWGVDASEGNMGLALIFIDTSGNVTITNVFGTARTFTGQVTNGNLVITANQTVYGGIKLIWLT